MKEKIYTIPLNEAFDADSECPFCTLAEKTDSDILEYVLGPSYMEEDVREETDKLGFCREHYYKIFHAKNRLGVALMVSTHMKKLNTRLAKALSEEAKSADGGLFSRKKASPVADFVAEVGGSCYACERAGRRMDGYFDTFFYLWKSEPEFREKVKDCKGFCLEHLSRLASEGRQKLAKSKFEELLSVLTELEAANLSRIDGELDWFIRKFDYRFKDEPWGNSKDSLERAILKISSASMEEKKEIK